MGQANKGDFPMNRTRARQIAREMFPCEIYGVHYSSYEALSKKDPICRDDVLDHIQYGEPF